MGVRRTVRAGHGRALTQRGQHLLQLVKAEPAPTASPSFVSGQKLPRSGASQKARAYRANCRRTQRAMYSRAAEVSSLCPNLTRISSAVLR